MNGVSRDALLHFVVIFSTFSEGEKLRVPALNSKWQAEEWQTISRLFTKGFKDQNIFSLHYDSGFFWWSIYYKIFNDAFLSYVSPVERHLRALQKESFDEKLFDEPLDMLDRFACTQRPTKKNLQSLINNIAHKELIQKPKYATDNMAIGCRDVLLTHFISDEKILVTYKDLEQTQRTIIKMIDAMPKRK